MTEAVEKPKQPVTVNEFVKWTMTQPKGRYELVDGEIIAMAPERSRHALTKHRVARTLEDAVDKARLDCTTFPDGMTVKIDQYTSYEPDCVIQCDGYIDMDSVFVDQPLIIVEVLSPSTRHLDVGGKLADYFRVKSVVHYLIINTKSSVVTHHRRGDKDGMIETTIIGDGSLRLDPPGLLINVAELFVKDSAPRRKS